MPVPMWIARVNKHGFNKLVLKKGTWPVLTHVGRSSGKTYRVPLVALRVDGGFIFILMYGSGCDWAKNVLAAGTAKLNIGTDEFELVSPRLVTKEEAWRQLPAGTKGPAKFLHITEYLQMDIRR
jgi:deazaflavin-dependent oxidoreductase (nitroreductase family)